MKAILTHTSALEFLRSTNASRSLRPQPSRSSTTGDPISDERIIRIQQTHSLSLPIHLMIERGKKRPNTSRIIYHTRNEALPRSSLLHIDEGLFTASPELCFIQLSSTYDITHHIAVGYELCGTYRPGNQYNYDPLTTITKLNTFTQRAPSMHGIAQAQRALRYVLPNSASSMETAFSMLLNLPPLLGGERLTTPILNFRINPGKSTQHMTSQEYYKCDLYWEKARLAVEYDSNLCHTEPRSIAKDSRRRDELSALGVTVLTVTAGQVYNLDAFNKVVHTIAKHLGERRPTRDKRFVERQLALRAALLNNPRR